MLARTGVLNLFESCTPTFFELPSNQPPCFPIKAKKVQNIFWGKTTLKNEILGCKCETL